MKSARLSDLKKRLSYYLRFVRRGQSVLVFDRDGVIARIEPVRASEAPEAADWIAQLERSGALRAPSAALPNDWLTRRVQASGNVVQALLQEREFGR